MFHLCESLHLKNKEEYIFRFALLTWCLKRQCTIHTVLLSQHLQSSLSCFFLCCILNRHCTVFLYPADSLSQVIRIRWSIILARCWNGKLWNFTFIKWENCSQKSETAKMLNSWKPFFLCGIYHLEGEDSASSLPLWDPTLSAATISRVLSTKKILSCLEAPKQGYKENPRAGTPALWKQTEIVWVVQPRKEKALVTSHCSLQVL